MNKIVTVFMLSVIFYATFANESKNILEDEYSDYNTNIYKKYVEMDKQIKGLAQQSVKKLLPFLLEARGNVNISASCSRNLFELITGFRKLTNWSLNFLDAMGKPQSGFLVGNIHMFGEYEECIDTMVKKNGKVDFQGKYCLLFIRPFLPKVKKIPRFHDKLQGLDNATRNSSDLTRRLVARAHGFYHFSIRMGLCVPSGCSKQDMSEIINYSLGDYVNTTVRYCIKKGDIYYWTTRRIVIVTIFVFFGMIVVLSTCLDNFSEKWKNNKLGLKSRILQSFSVTRNFQKLMNTDQSNISITCLNGVRVLTIFWIILGHEYYIHLMTMTANHIMKNYEALFKSFISQIVVNGFMAVEIFFFISGFVNCYVRMLIKQSGSPQPGILKMIFQRLWRIYPAYIISFLLLDIMSTPQPFTYYIQEELVKNCEHNSWRNFLFINNFFSPFSMCLAQSWFISADMQLFLVTLFTIPVLLSKPTRGIILHVVIILIVNLCTMSYWFLLDDVPAPTLDGTRLDRSILEKSYHIYTLPFVHVGPYFIGIMMGYIIATKKEVKIAKLTQLFGWLVASFLFLSMLFITVRWNSGNQSSQFENSLYGAWSKTISVLGFSWLIYTCSTGHARLINYILSLKLWIPLSRITYMLFLVSPLIQSQQSFHIRFPQDFSDMSIIWSYFGDLSISLLMSFSLVLIYESPLIALEKVLLRKNQSEQKISPKVQVELTSSNINENGKIVTIHL